VKEKPARFEKENPYTKHKCYIIWEKPTLIKEGTRTSTTKFKTTKSCGHHLLLLLKKPLKFPT
jgi:hypothetical protein